MEWSGVGGDVSLACHSENRNREEEIRQFSVIELSNSGRYMDSEAVGDLLFQMVGNCEDLV